MRPIITVALLAMLAAPAVARAPATFTNPILFADYSDPDIVRVGRDYYLIASSFHFSPGIPILKSRDLVNWKIVGHVLPKLPFSPLYDMPGPHTLTDAITKPIGGTKYASGVWAPALRHHAGKFWVYFATPDEGVFMSTATRVEGPWTPPVLVIDSPKLEDPCPFWDDDGSAWLIHGRVGAGPLVLHRMSPDGTRVLDDGVVVAEDKVRLPILEGPKLYKRNGWYYIWAPIGGVSTGPQAVGRARRITGPYEWRDVLVPGNGLKGPHQGGWVETPSGQGWFVHFNSDRAFGRVTHLQPVRWQDDWPIIGEPVPGQTGGLPVRSHAMPDTGHAPTRDRLQDSDDFKGAKLGLQWSWNHNPDDTAWSLSARPGFMRLTAGPAQQIVNARNTLTQILQGPARQITTRIDVARMADGQRAGLSLFGAKPNWIGIVQQGTVRSVTLSKEGVETPGPALTGRTIDLRAVVAADQTVRYSYSLDGGRRFVTLGDAVPLAAFSWWKGSRPALFSFTRGTGKGSIDVDWFRVEAPTL
jgi:beta-xylosidase